MTKKKGQNREKVIKNTNITLRKVTQPDRVSIFNKKENALLFLEAILPDDQSEAKWIESLRPEHNLIKPSKAFLEGTKTLRSSLDFYTFSLEKMRQRRLKKRVADQKRYQLHRRKQVVPTVAMKAITKPHIISKTGDIAPMDEQFLFSHDRRKGTKEGHSKKRRRADPLKEEWKEIQKEKIKPKIGKRL